MSIAPAPNESAIATALVQFLASILAPGLPVLLGYQNRVAEPQAADFVIVSPLSRRRLETNTDTGQDCSFIASVSGTSMIVSSVLLGALTIGNTLQGPNVVNPTTITAGPANGGVGTYTLSQAQTLPSQKMQCGTWTMMQPTEITFQVDVHGPNSADNAQAITTVFRDDYAVSFFDALGIAAEPLYADEARYLPFVNEAKQWEDRYVLEVCLQANQAVTAPQEFADTVTIPARPAQIFPI